MKSMWQKTQIQTMPAYLPKCTTGRLEERPGHMAADGGTLPESRIYMKAAADRAAEDAKKKAGSRKK